MAWIAPRAAQQSFSLLTTCLLYTSRAHPVALGQDPQRRARPDQVLLPHHLVERPGAEPGGQRGLRCV